jgi:hypothetical protein
VQNIHLQPGLTTVNILWAFEPPSWPWHAHLIAYGGYSAPWAASMGHHATSLFLHAVNVVCFSCYVALPGFCGAAYRGALFALHPSMLCVAWVSERKAFFVPFFYFCVFAYGWYIRKPGVVRYSTVVVLFALDSPRNHDHHPAIRASGSIIGFSPVFDSEDLKRVPLFKKLWPLVWKIPLFVLSRAVPTSRCLLRYSQRHRREGFDFPGAWRTRFVDLLYIPKGCGLRA